MVDKQNEDEFDEELTEDEAAVAAWFKESIPKEFMAILNTDKYAVVCSAIKKIVSILAESCEKEDMPDISIRFDRLFGSDLALKIIVPEVGITIDVDQIRDFASSLPDDCRMLILPRTDNKVLISFTFHNVKTIILPEDLEDPEQ